MQVQLIFKNMLMVSRVKYSDPRCSSSHVQMWELDHKDGWALKNWNFWAMVLEKTLDSPWTARRSNQLILKEINPECSLEGLTLKLKFQYFGTWCEEPTHWKRPWCWGRLKAGGEGAVEDETVGWHHWLNGHELKQSLKDCEGQGSQACCSPWGHKSWTRLSD